MRGSPCRTTCPSATPTFSMRPGRGAVTAAERLSSKLIRPGAGKGASASSALAVAKSR